MKKRIVIVLPVLLLILAGVFLFGAVKRNFELTLKDGETVLLQKNYNIKPATRLKVFFLYKNDYAALYEDLQNPTAALDELNVDLKKDLALATKSVEYPASDATVSWDGLEFHYCHETEGVSVDQNGISSALFQHMGRNIAIEVQKSAVQPMVKEEFLRKITVQISSYATSYASSSAPRKNNISLAVSYINGTVLAPGERFSFNEIVGERTTERGFMESKIISGGHFVKGVGGGVCQVSTTLYNSALRAGLKIIKVSNHSLPVGYVPLSFDAMVTSCSDLVFENDSAYPVYIKGESNGEKLLFTFYGDNKYEGRSLEYRTEIVKVLVSDEYEDICDSTQLQEGERYKIISAPKNGYISEAYVDIYENEKLISSVRIRHDTYLPQKGVRIVPDKINETARTYEK
ncbi:MAG: VanW family protein [Clostridia bacterium]|nr:VanW family protein [Clostridia bacterium]